MLRRGRSEGSAEGTTVPALPVRWRGYAATWCRLLVRRYQQHLRDARGADPDRAQHGNVGSAALGHGRRRLLRAGADQRRALHALVPVRHLLPGVPRSWTRVAQAPALELRTRDRSDLPLVPRAALPPDALHLYARLAGAHAGAADDAALGAELRRRSPRLGARKPISLGRRSFGGAGDARGRHAMAGLSPRGPLARFLDSGRPRRASRDRGRGTARSPAAAGARRRDHPDGAADAASRAGTLERDDGADLPRGALELRAL